MLVLHAVLSSGQLILSTNNKATVPSHSFDNFDNFTASPSSEQEIRNDVPGPMNKAAKHLRHQLVWPIFIVPMVSQAPKEHFCVHMNMFPP